MATVKVLEIYGKADSITSQVLRPFDCLASATAHVKRFDRESGPYWQRAIVVESSEGTAGEEKTL